MVTMTELNKESISNCITNELGIISPESKQRILHTIFIQIDKILLNHTLEKEKTYVSNVKEIFFLLKRLQEDNDLLKTTLKHTVNELQEIKQLLPSSKKTKKQKTEPNNNKSIDLDKLTFSQLVDICTENNIKLKSRIKKEEIIELIKGKYNGKK